MNRLRWSSLIVVSMLALLATALSCGAANVFVSTVVIGMSTRSAGDYSFSPVTVPTGVVGLQFMMDLSQATDPIPALSASLEGSLDGGTTWIPAGAFSRLAGNKTVLPGGTVIQTTGATFAGGDFWKDTTNVNRRLRGVASIGGTLRFALTVQPL